MSSWSTKNSTRKGTRWSTAKALQQFVLVQLHILFPHFNREEHHSAEVSLCFFFESKVPLSHIHIIFFRDTVYSSIVILSCFVTCSKKIMKPMYSRYMQCTGMMRVSLSTLDFKILCNTATRSEICPLPLHHICREVQVMQSLRSQVSRTTESGLMDSKYISNSCFKYKLTANSSTPSAYNAPILDFFNPSHI